MHFPVFYLTHGEMRNFSVCHVNFPERNDEFPCVFFRTDKEMCISLCVHEKILSKFGTHKEIQIFQ